jgi:hypothetical protein
MHWFFKIPQKPMHLEYGTGRETKTLPLEKKLNMKYSSHMEPLWQMSHKSSSQKPMEGQMF